MKYSNPKIPEGINTGSRHPLKDLALLLGGVTAAVVVVALALGLSADVLAKKIPFEIEQRWSQAFFDSTATHPLEGYLDALAGTLAQSMDPSGKLEVRVRYSDSDEVNAYAFLGGNIMVTRGLLEKLGDENTLTMLLAHEVAHVVLRHPIRSTGRALVIAAFLAATFGFDSDWIGGNLVSDAGLITQLKFSRDQERAADAMALAALERHYGHIGGAATLFEIFLETKQGAGRGTAALFGTHPAVEERLAAVHARSAALPSPGPGTLTSLPTDFQRLLVIPVDAKIID